MKYTAVVPTKMSSQSALEMRQTLAKYTVSDLLAAAPEGNGAGGVIELDSSMRPVDAAQVLWKHNILGAPVWDAEKEHYVGFFDMRDILSAVVEYARAMQEEEGSDSDAYNAIMVSNLEQGMQLKNLHYLAARNHFYSCSYKTNLIDLCEILSKRGCHRVPIVEGSGNDAGRCQNIISQSALVKFLSATIPSTNTALDQTLDEAKIPYRKEVVSIVDTASAYDAFSLLDSKRLSGIAVVDEDGMLVGNTSARDIKYAAIDGGRTAMEQDILSYLSVVRQSSPGRRERSPICSVRYDSTVRRLINLLAKTAYHRVFVVDDKKRPVGVISVADVIRFAIGNSDQ
uniref:CBS domain-containing protein n=1 Tax=Ditylum brightwellii TaxID=49249 RepID=A0A7S2ESY2_9STRA|mmetsp:Transcript_6349/g.9628  ORF Transcript_6349/g.9628 Transcript_6349/m.9628 type:complete len:342 (+) Transcript_6349:59-1084(+)